MRAVIALSLLWSLALGASFPQAASAAQNAAARFVGDQVTLSLVAEEPDDTGDFRAAVVIDLAPGWKTYWLDPGDAGIPPSVDLSGSRNTTLLSQAFPAPHRFSDDYGSSNGYSEPMAIALRLHEVLVGENTEVHAKVFIGVCHDICVPVSADLVATPGNDGDGVVNAAFGALPSAGDANSRILGAALSDDAATLTIAAEAQGAGPRDVFVAGPAGWAFGVAKPVASEGEDIRFALPVLSKPRHADPAPPPLDIVMTSEGDAVGATLVPTTTP